MELFALLFILYFITFTKLFITINHTHLLFILRLLFILYFITFTKLFITINHTYIFIYQYYCYGISC